MRDDYRNYLFEAYIRVVKHYKPSAFVFENVQGICSAKPGGMPIIDRIKAAFNDAGYEIIQDLKGKTLIDFSMFGVPQNRKRIIILGLRKSEFGEKSQKLLNLFYDEILPSYHCSKKSTVRDFISDLPPLYPADNDYSINGKRFSHRPNETEIVNHSPRYHNRRDIEIFKELARDIETGSFKYQTTDSVKELYTNRTGNTSNVHKYYVLRWDEQSNTIPAHLLKDGLRHIHPDALQARSITVREAARLQTFSDDFLFTGSQTDNYRMIGNAVPPLFSKFLALSVAKVLSGDN